MTHPEATPDQFEINEKFFRAMPRLGTEDDERVKADIVENGVKIPITVRSDMTIIDGHQRHRIISENPQAKQAIPYQIESKYDDLDENALIIEIISINIKRRQLNTMQMAVVGWRAAEALGWVEAAKERMAVRAENEDLGTEVISVGKTDFMGSVAEQISKVFGISLQAVKLVKRLKDAEEFVMLTDTTSGEITQKEAISRMRAKEGRAERDKPERDPPVKAVIPTRMGREVYESLGFSFIKNNFSAKSEAVILLLIPVDAKRADREDQEAERTWKQIPFKDWTCTHGVVGGCWRCYPEPASETGKKKKSSVHRADEIVLPVDRKEIGGFTILPDKTLEACSKCELYDDINDKCEWKKGEPLPGECRKFRKES